MAPWARPTRSPLTQAAPRGRGSHLLTADERRIASDDQVTGKLLENFVAMEIVKHRDWAQTDARIHHYRDGRDEIDLLLENRSGEIAAIEVKAGATLAARDWRALAKLRDRAGDKFRAGVVIHSGRQTLPLADRLWAIPLSGLWA